MDVISSLTAGGVNGLLTGIGTFAKDIRVAITGKDPVKEAEAMQKLLEIEFAAQKAQSDINLVEAQNPNLFVSGWRPAVGWVCTAALAWYYVVAPFLTWFLKLFNVQSVTIPQFDTGSLITLLFGLLGIGGLRSYEKIKGVAGK
jgi:hypothetical protein